MAARPSSGQTFLSWQRLGLLPLGLLLSFVGRSSALTQKYCSNQNTGSGNGATYWPYQSNGWCSTHCDNYAFAIVQDNNCWCSNYIPANQQSIGSCNDNCPGFPDEKCGNQGQSLFGYVALSNSPSGTQGGASSTAAASSASSSAPQSSSRPSSAPASTVIQTVTASASVIVSYITPSSSTPSSSTTPTPSSSTPAPSTTDVPSTSTTPTPTPSSSSSSSSSRITSTPSTSQPAPAPVTSIIVSTVSGAVVTQTVITQPTAPSESQSLPQAKGVSVGAVAGAVVGSVAGVALLGAFFIWFFFRRRRNDGDAETVAAGGPTKPNSPRRNVSTLSRTGLLNRPEKAYPPTIITTRHSMNGLDDSQGVSPISERRNSRPLFYDQRLNPSALMSLDNGSRNSMTSIQDNRDYTRTLGVMNPDADRASMMSEKR